jgi:hypothetical protein
MNRYGMALTALFIASFQFVAVPQSAVAQSTGLAWDSVTKMAMNADLSSLQPGSFDADYAAAASAQPPAQGGGIFSQIKQAMGAGQSMQQMMQNGFAQHHYVAGSKERTDDVVAQTARIVDCSARTITTLDLQHKTYKVVSMDQPSSGGGGRSTGSSFADNGTRVAIAVNNTALGARNVSGQSTNGFRSDMTMTETSASGQSRTQNAGLLGYYSSYPNPAPACSLLGLAGAGSRGAGMMAGYGTLMRALGSAGTDSRFSIKQSGPQIPFGSLAMFEAVAFGTQGQGPAIITERGNVRSISPNDPVFSVPAGFTAQQ